MMDKSKKPGMAVMIGIGKPEPKPLSRLDKEPEPEPEPERGEMEGGDSDDDIDTVLNAVPEMAEPVRAMFAAMANYCRQHKGDGMPNESDSENYPA